MKTLATLITILLFSFGIFWYLTSENVPREVRDAVRTAIDETGEIITDKAGEVKKTVAAPPPLRKALTGKLGEDLSIDGVLEWTNTHRKEGELDALSINAELNSAAKTKLDDMFARQYFEHVSPDGEGPSDIVETAGYDYIAVGENLALGNYDDDKALVQAWMDSPGHRANILGADFTEIGIAVGKGTFEGHVTWLAVQEFGRPLSDCPQPEEALNGQITANKAKLDAMKREADSRKTVLNASSEPKTQQEVDEYNANVNAFNDLVRNINAMIGTIQGQITVFNGQVQAFNSCAGDG